jgi:hypothetical protein
MLVVAERPTIVRKRASDHVPCALGHFRGKLQVFPPILRQLKDGSSI